MSEQCCQFSDFVAIFSQYSDPAGDSLSQKTFQGLFLMLCEAGSPVLTQQSFPAAVTAGDDHLSVFRTVSDSACTRPSLAAANLEKLN